MYKSDHFTLFLSNFIARYLNSANIVGMMNHLVWCLYCLLAITAAALASGDSITLFDGYANTGTPYTFTASTPNVGAIAGRVSSFVVTSGRWSLYSGYDYGGTKISLHGETEFGPGTYNFCTTTSCEPFNDKTLSVKLLSSKITLFDGYANTGTPYVFTDSTPDVGAIAGRVSSFVVTSGVWSLYSGYDYGGTKISLHGKTEFGPGTYNFCTTTSCEPFNDKTLSVELLSYKITLFDGYANTGTPYVFTDSTPDVGAIAGRVSSFVVTSGVWSLYSGYDYGGTKISLHGKTEFGPGTYNFCTTTSCEPFNDKTLSVELLSYKITLFDGYANTGTPYVFTDSTPDVGAIAGRVSSFVVTSGVWSLYSGYDYGGTKISLHGETEFGPGTYNFCTTTSCEPFNDKTLSVELLSYKITLFDGYANTGTPYVFTESTPNVGAIAGRVSSFVVTSGVWSLYSGYDYGGTKISLHGKTEFGPGTYNFCTTTSCEPFNDKTLSVELLSYKITLFDGYANTGTPYVFTDSTPDVGAIAGRVSSFIVTSGVWSLYSGYDYGGTKISLHGKTEFGPGTYNFCTTTSCEPFNDKTLSMKIVYK